MFRRTKCSSSEDLYVQYIQFYGVFMRRYKQPGRCQDVCDTLQLNEIINEKNMYILLILTTYVYHNARYKKTQSP